MTLYVLGQYTGRMSPDEFAGVAWELAGVFSTREAAVRMCRGRDFFVGPVEMDTFLPVERTEWPGCEYPLGKFESTEDFEAWQAKRKGMQVPE